MYINAIYYMFAVFADGLFLQYYRMFFFLQFCAPLAPVCVFCSDSPRKILICIFREIKTLGREDNFRFTVHPDAPIIILLPRYIMIIYTRL